MLRGGVLFSPAVWGCVRACMLACLGVYNTTHVCASYHSTLLPLLQHESHIASVSLCVCVCLTLRRGRFRKAGQGALPVIRVGREG